MKNHSFKQFYLVVAEFSHHRIGLIIYNGSEWLSAKTLMDCAMNEMESYSFTESFELPLNLLKKYRKYNFKGEEYCTSSKKYQNESTISNGDLSVCLIRSENRIDNEHFIWYRNLPMDWGFSTN